MGIGITSRLAMVMSAEVNTLVALHGVAPEAALEIIGLPRRRYVPTAMDAGYLPTPEIIEAKTAAIKSGELIVNEKSVEKWEKARRGAELAKQAEAAAIEFELAGRLPDDDCELPAWLYSANEACL